MVLKRSKKRRPSGFSSTIDNRDNSNIEGGVEKKRGFTAKKSNSSSCNQLPYNEDSIKGY